MFRTLHKAEQESISMPCQVKSLFDVFPQMNVDLIDYDYIGEAKEEDYSSLQVLSIRFMEIVTIVFW